MTVNGIWISGRRILIVEDNFHIAGAIARVLKAQGAEIIGPVGTVKDAFASSLSPSASKVRCWIRDWLVKRKRPV